MLPTAKATLTRWNAVPGSASSSATNATAPAPQARAASHAWARASAAWQNDAGGHEAADADAQQREVDARRR